MKDLWFWFSEAATIFANGLLHGAAAGGTAALALLKSGATPQVALLSGLSVAASNGVKRVLVWSDPNPIPNPFPGWVTPADDPAPPAAPLTPACEPAGSAAAAPVAIPAA